MLVPVDIIRRIENLQKAEKRLYKKLDADNNDSKNTRIINNINNLTKKRTILFEKLQKTGDTYNSVIDMNENTLNNHKDNLNSLQNMKNSKVRLIKLHTYYGKKYDAYSEMFKSILIICTAILVLAILYRNRILPPTLFNIMTI